MSRKEKPNSTLNFLGGASGGMMACITLQPLDLIKTRLQQQRQDHLAFLKEAKSKGLIVAPHKSNIYSTIKDIVHQNGYSGLWRGTVPTIMRNVPGSAFYFFALSEIRQILKNNRATWQPLLSKNKISERWESLVSGATARGTVAYVMMPITVIKVRYESNFYNYNSLGDAFKSIIKKDGIKGLFAGYGATFIRDAPFAGIYLFFYEGMKSWAHAKNDANQDRIPEILINMGSGVMAGSAATCTTQPFDMLKTRMQLKPNTYRNLIQSVHKVFMEEGVMGFFDGISVRLIRKPMNSAISWTIYEEVVRWHHRKNALIKERL